jgi:hypothetical protein
MEADAPMPSDGKGSNDNIIAASLFSASFIKVQAHLVGKRELRVAFVKIERPCAGLR